MHSLLAQVSLMELSFKLISKIKINKIVFAISPIMNDIVLAYRKE